MNFADIRKLIRLAEQSNLSELEIEEGGLRVRIAKQIHRNGTAPHSAPMDHAESALLAATVSPTPGSAAAAPTAPDNSVAVTSPMVGTFYQAPSPEAPPYVQVGDIVKAGQVLCIIEAMKLMNEIEAEHAGRIIETLVENAEPVEFGQILFRIEPA